MSLPSCDRDSAFAGAPSANEDWGEMSPPGPLDVWGPYPSDPTKGGRKLLTTHVLVEFPELNNFVATHYGY